MDYDSGQDSGTTNPENKVAFVLSGGVTAVLSKSGLSRLSWSIKFSRESW